MNEKILKNKKVWVAAVIVLTVLVGILFHLNLKKKSYALQALSKASNLTLTQLTPKWTKYLPSFAIEYLKPTFPVSATFSLEEAVSIIEDPEENDSFICLSLLCHCTHFYKTAAVASIQKLYTRKGRPNLSVFTGK